MRIVRKGMSITIILIVLLLVYTTPVSALTLTRDDIVTEANNQEEEGSHYLYGTQGIKCTDSGPFWDDHLWNYNTTKWIWDAFPGAQNRYLFRTGSGTKEDQYWDRCQGKGGGETTPKSCVGVRHFDCSGLAYWIYTQAMYSEDPMNKRRNANEYYKGSIETFKKEKREQFLQPGDLCFAHEDEGIFKHVGIYVGEDRVIHAKGHDYGVINEPLDGNWTDFGRILPSPLIHTVTVTSDQPDYLECSALKPDENRSSNFNELGSCHFAPKVQEITVSVTWDGGENNAEKNSWRYSPCFGNLGSDWIDIEDNDEPVEYKKRIDMDHLTDSDLEIQVRNEYGSIDTINIHFETEDSIGVFVIKPNGFVREGNRIIHKNLSWTFGAECNNVYRSKSGETVSSDDVSDINEAIDILGWEEGGEFNKIDGHDAYCIENVRQYSGINQIYLVDWSQEPCRSEALLMSPPESSGLFSRCDVIDAHYSLVFSSFPDWLNDVAYSGDTSVYFPIDVTMHYRYQDRVFDAMDKSTEREFINKAEAELSIAYYVPHLSFVSVSKNVLVFLKDEGWIEIHYHGASFFEEDLDVLDEMLRNVKIGWESEIPMDQRQYMCRLCTIAITSLTTSQQQHTPSSIAPQETVLTSESSKLKGSTVIPYQATGYKFKVFPLGEVPENFCAPDFNDFDFLIRDAAFGSEGDLCPLQSTIKTFWHTDSEIVLRKSFLLPANASNLRVLVAIDNDVQVLINGVDISGGLVTHECCPILDEFLFEVPDSLLQEGENLLAVRARDRGVESYVDLRVLVDGDGSLNREISDDNRPPLQTVSENEIGGFEVTSAIGGILGVVYLLRRRRLKYDG